MYEETSHVTYGGCSFSNTMKGVALEEQQTRCRTDSASAGRREPGKLRWQTIPGARASPGLPLIPESECVV